MAGGGQVGGMGDVVTALGRAVQDEGHDVSVILPKYDVLRYGAISELTPGREFWFENVQVRAWHGIVQGALSNDASPPPSTPPPLHGPPGGGGREGFYTRRCAALGGSGAPAPAPLSHKSTTFNQQPINQLTTLRHSRSTRNSIQQ